MITIESDAKTSAAHGCSPDERSVEELLEAGMIVIDKPPGPNNLKLLSIELEKTACDSVHLNFDFK